MRIEPNAGRSRGRGGPSVPLNLPPISDTTRTEFAQQAAAVMQSALDKKSKKAAWGDNLEAAALKVSETGCCRESLSGLAVVSFRVSDSPASSSPSLQEQEQGHRQEGHKSKKVRLLLILLILLNGLEHYAPCTPSLCAKLKQYL